MVKQMTYQPTILDILYVRDLHEIIAGYIYHDIFTVKCAKKTQQTLDFDYIASHGISAEDPFAEEWNKLGDRNNRFSWSDIGYGVCS